DPRDGPGQRRRPSARDRSRDFLGYNRDATGAQVNGLHGNHQAKRAGGGEAARESAGVRRSRSEGARSVSALPIPMRLDWDPVANKRRVAIPSGAIKTSIPDLCRRAEIPVLVTVDRDVYVYRG